MNVKTATAKLEATRRRGDEATIEASVIKSNKIVLLDDKFCKEYE